MRNRRDRQRAERNYNQRQRPERSGSTPRSAYGRGAFSASRYGHHDSESYESAGQVRNSRGTRGTSDRRGASDSSTRRPSGRFSNSQAEERSARQRRAAANSATQLTGEARSYSRSSMQPAIERARKKRRGRKVRHIVLAAVITVLVVGAGTAFALYQYLNGNLHAGLDADLQGSLVQSDLTKEPFYMLLLGTDKSESRENSAQYAGDSFRSDSIILLRVDPVNKKATMVSLHRDTLVDMGEHGQQKLNAAYSYGGASYMVDTVSSLAGVGISHYAEIDFDAFKDVVDALGGVEVDVPVEINDEKAGGHLDKGKQTLNGEQALILCRSRHTYDAQGDGDAYRAANQRLVLSAIAKKILQSDPATLANAVNVISQYVTTDLSVNDILALAQCMQGIDPDNDIYTGMEPTTSKYINNVWYEITDVEAWQKMMSRVDEGLPPNETEIIDEATGTVLATSGSQSSKVVIRNGNGKSGVAAAVEAILKDKGYQFDTGNADNFKYPTTLIIYNDDSQAEEANSIQQTLGKGQVQKNDGSYEFDGDFLVIVGADWS